MSTVLIQTPLRFFACCVLRVACLLYHINKRKGTKTFTTLLYVNYYITPADETQTDKWRNKNPDETQTGKRRNKNPNETQTGVGRTINKPQHK
ncbi:MAG: hypothetical protein LBQ05_03365 [Christensenellaceae bacterium]|nr:hypothetical protein [Christensenellaceae bacterium]